MSQLPFDEYAHQYDATVQRAIGASGETVQYFAALKAKLMARTLQRVGDKPKSALDFGCGIGNGTREVVTVLPDSRVVGVDPSPESIATARRVHGGDRTDFQVIADDGLPFPDGTFDCALAACVFHHIEPGERARWTSEIRRVLRSGGKFFLFEHNPYNPLTRRVVARVPFDEGVKLLTAHDAAALLRNAGFETAAPTFYFFFPRFLRRLRFIEPWLRHLPIGAQYFIQATNDGR